MAKKTTAAKPAAKKTTAKPAAKPVEKKSTEISVRGNKKIKTLEKEFDTVFGLYAQVCYYDPDGKAIIQMAAMTKRHYRHSMQSVKRMVV